VGEERKRETGEERKREGEGRLELQYILWKHTIMYVRKMTLPPGDSGYTHMTLHTFPESFWSVYASHLGFQAKLRSR